MKPFFFFNIFLRISENFQYGKRKEREQLITPPCSGEKIKDNPF